MCVLEFSFGQGEEEAEVAPAVLSFLYFEATIWDMLHRQRRMKRVKRVKRAKRAKRRVKRATGSPKPRPSRMNQKSNHIEQFCCKGKDAKSGTRSRTRRTAQHIWVAQV